MSRRFVFILLLVPTCFAQTSQAQCREITSACGTNLASTLQTRLVEASVPGVSVNGNEVISASAILNFIRAKHDLNADGCLTLEEWNKTTINTILTNKQYRNFAEASTPCAAGQGIEIANIYPNNPQLTTSALQYNIYIPLEYLVATCEASPDLYTSDCDCAQLPDACRDPKYASTPVCFQYKKTTAARKGSCIFSPPAPTSALTALDVCSDVVQVAKNPVAHALCKAIAAGDTTKTDWVAQLLQQADLLVKENDDLGSSSSSSSSSESDDENEDI